MSIAELKEKVVALTNSERIELMEVIWDSLDNKDDEIESPAWHGDVLAERAAKIESGEAQFLTVDQLKERLQS